MKYIPSTLYHWIEVHSNLQYAVEDIVARIVMLMVIVVVISCKNKQICYGIQLSYELFGNALQSYCCFVENWVNGKWAISQDRLI